MLVFRERPGWQCLIGILVAFAGVVLIAGQPDLRGELWPMFLVMGGAFTWAVGQIMVKRLGVAVGGFALIAWVGVFAGPQMIVASLLIESGQAEALRSATWVGWGTVIYLGLVMTALGYGIWFRVLARNPVSQVMPVLLLLPVFGVIGSIVILGERPGPSVLLGGAIVVAGVSMIVLKRTARA
jgi:O-acetylserine/cysteine efflux transporter